jgi:hypothetical protein
MLPWGRAGARVEAVGSLQVGGKQQAVEVPPGLPDSETRSHGGGQARETQRDFLTCDVCDGAEHGIPGARTAGEYSWAGGAVVGALASLHTNNVGRPPVRIVIASDRVQDTRPQISDPANRTPSQKVPAAITVRHMATQQDEGGVPFAMAHEMQQFRLFELPPELVELLDAPDPPLYVLCPSRCCARVVLNRAF